jgi:hypothetical protein
MSNPQKSNADAVGPAKTARVSDDHRVEKTDLDEIERAHSADLDKTVHTRYDKVDKELAKYVGGEAIDISPEENTRLRRLIDKRVLVIMISTYFIQAIDKGTMSFASIMGIRDDAHLVGQQVSGRLPPEQRLLTTSSRLTEYPTA